jgi:large subunit ribosomal protein L17
MRHQMKNQRFDRPTDARLALFRGLVTQLLQHEQIKTTQAKAKAIRPLAEKMIARQVRQPRGTASRPRLHLRH